MEWSFWHIIALRPIWMYSRPLFTKGFSWWNEKINAFVENFFSFFFFYLFYFFPYSSLLFISFPYRAYPMLYSFNTMHNFEGLEWLGDESLNFQSPYPYRPRVLFLPFSLEVAWPLRYASPRLDHFCTFMADLVRSWTFLRLCWF